MTTTTARKTIARNHTRRIAAVRAAIKRATVSTLDNGFSGVEVADPQAVITEWQGHAFSRLTEDVPGEKWTVHVHDNRWYTLYAAPAEQPAAPAAEVVEHPAAETSIVDAAMNDDDEAMGRANAEALLSGKVWTAAQIGDCHAMMGAYTGKRAAAIRTRLMDELHEMALAEHAERQPASDDDILEHVAGYLSIVACDTLTSALPADVDHVMYLDTPDADAADELLAAGLVELVDGRHVLTRLGQRLQAELVDPSWAAWTHDDEQPAPAAAEVVEIAPAPAEPVTPHADGLARLPLTGRVPVNARGIPTITDPDLILMRFDDEKPDDFGRRRFMAYWLDNNVGPRCDEIGTRGQVFHSEIAKWLDRETRQGKTVADLETGEVLAKPLPEHYGPFVTMAVVETWALLHRDTATVPCDRDDEHDPHEGAAELFTGDASCGYVPAQCPGIIAQPRIIVRQPDEPPHVRMPCPACGETTDTARQQDGSLTFVCHRNPHRHPQWCDTGGKPVDAVTAPTPHEQYQLAYGYALAVLHLSGTQGVRYGIDTEADVQAFAAAYEAFYVANPYSTPEVSSAFGEWRTTGNMIDLDVA